MPEGSSNVKGSTTLNINSQQELLAAGLEKQRRVSQTPLRRCVKSSVPELVELLICRQGLHMLDSRHQ